MRERDRELIAALVEGRLEDETEARALIASSEEARREYEAQLLARSALTELPPVRMTEAEKAALHRDLWTRLRSEQPRPRPSRRVRWSFAVAVLFLLVGLAGVLSQGLTGGLAEQALEAPLEDAPLQEAPLEENADAGVVTTEAPALSPVLPAPEELAPADQAEAAQTATVASDLELLTRVAEKVRAGELDSPALDYDYSGALRTAWDACLVEAGLAKHQPVGDVTGQIRYLIAVPADTPIGPDTPVFFVDADTCTLVHIDE